MLAGLGTAAGGTVPFVEEVEVAAAVDFVAAQVAGYVSTGPLIGACIAAGSAGGPLSSAWRLRRRDWRSFGLLWAGATVVEEEIEATLA